MRVLLAGVCVVKWCEKDDIDEGSLAAIRTSS